MKYANSAEDVFGWFLVGANLLLGNFIMAVFVAAMIVITQ